MPGVCLLVAGATVAQLATSAFTLAWRHSVEKVRWEERYRVEGRQLALVEARIEGMGAGMEPPPGARFAEGAWTWQPAARLHDVLRLTLSPYTEDYAVCVDGTCTPLARLVAPAAPDVVEVRACDAVRSAPAR